MIEMELSEAILTRQLEGGKSEYRLTSCRTTKGFSYGLMITVTEGKEVRKSFADDITNDRDAGLALLIRMYEYGVDPCHLHDLIEDMLPVEGMSVEVIIKKPVHAGKTGARRR